MNERDEPEAAVNEAEALLFGELREEDRQIRMRIPFGTAFQIALHLGVPRLAHEVGEKRQALTPIEEIWGWASSDPNDTLDDPDTLLEHSVSGQHDDSPITQGLPFEESLLWILADKFPKINQLAAEPERTHPRFRSENYEIFLSQREVRALGHSILQTVYEDEEERPKPSDNPDFWTVERIKFRNGLRREDRGLIEACISLYRTFIEAGGVGDIQLYDELERLLRNLK